MKWIFLVIGIICHTTFAQDWNAGFDVGGNFVGAVGTNPYPVVGVGSGLGASYPPVSVAPAYPVGVGAVAAHDDVGTAVVGFSSCGGVGQAPCGHVGLGVGAVATVSCKGGRCDVGAPFHEICPDNTNGHTHFCEHPKVWSCLYEGGACICPEPPEGCPADTYWDVVFCGCIPECRFTVGTDYHWDGIQGRCVCDRRPERCPPCCVWDAAECQCVRKPCIDTGRCAFGTYFDVDQCMCVVSHCPYGHTQCPIGQSWNNDKCQCQKRNCPTQTLSCLGDPCCAYRAIQQLPQCSPPDRYDLRICACLNCTDPGTCPAIRPWNTTACACTCNPFLCIGGTPDPFTCACNCSANPGTVFNSTLNTCVCDQFHHFNLTTLRCECNFNTCNTTITTQDRATCACRCNPPPVPCGVVLGVQQVQNPTTCLCDFPCGSSGFQFDGMCLPCPNTCTLPQVITGPNCLCV